MHPGKRLFFWSMCCLFVLSPIVLLEYLRAPTMVPAYLMCGFSSQSANDPVEQRLGVNCILVDSDGALVANQLYPTVDRRLATNPFSFKRDSLWGYADTHGRTIAEPQYTIAHPYIDGRAMVCRENADRSRACGFLGLDGKPIFELQTGVYFNAYMRGPLTYADRDGHPYLVDRLGQRVNQPWWIAPCRAWIDSTVKARLKRSIPATGRLSMPEASPYRPLGVCQNALEPSTPSRPLRDQVLETWLGIDINHLEPLNEGVRLVETSYVGWGILRGADPKFVYGPVNGFDQRPNDTIVREGLLPVQFPLDAKLRLIYHEAPREIRFMTADGKFPMQERFEDAHGFYEGLAAARSAKNHLWGFVDRQGNWRVEPRYANVVDDFTAGRAVVTLALANDRSTEVLIDFRGRMIARYDQLRSRHFPDHLANEPDPMTALSCATYQECP